MSGSEWKEYKLSELMTIIGGGTPKTSIPEYWNGDIPWLSVKDFAGDNRFVYKTEKYITKEGLKNSSTKLLNKGDLIISARGTVGEVAQLKFDMTFNQSCYGLRANENTTNNFLFYLIKYTVRNIKKHTHGSVFDTITRKTFDNITVRVPTFNEQRKITNILSSLDKKIELNNQINQTLEEMAQAIFKHWFVDFEFPNENGEPYKSSGGKFVESELGMIPEGWEIKTLGEIAYIKGGKRLPKGQGVIENKTPYPYLRVKDFRIEGINYDSICYISKEVHELIKNYTISSDDVYISIAGTVGLTGLVPQELSGANLTENAAKIMYKSCEGLNKYFIYLYLISSDGQRQIISNTVGSTQPKLPLYGIRDIKMLVPNRGVLKEFTKITEQLYELKEIRLSNSLILKNLRDTLLPKLMSGEIRIPDAEQEVEACL